VVPSWTTFTAPDRSAKNSRPSGAKARAVAKSAATVSLGGLWGATAHGSGAAVVAVVGAAVVAVGGGARAPVADGPVEVGAAATGLLGVDPPPQPLNASTAATTSALRRVAPTSISAAGGGEGGDGGFQAVGLHRGSLVRGAPGQAGQVEPRQRGPGGLERRQ
jgi:hypothetical protein